MPLPATGAAPERRGAYWALVALLAACFALGGSARADVPQLLILRPLTALFLGFGLWTLTSRDIGSHRFLLAFVLAAVALPALQLIPLPPGLWQRLPGRELLAEIDRVAGVGPIWRPLTLTPTETANALFACLAPLAGIILGIQLGERHGIALLPVVLSLGVASALLGLMQTLGDPRGPLYFFTITNDGSAVGFFANRNHQAQLLAMMPPMLAVAAATGGPGPRLLAWVAGLALLPLILVTGSRSGLIVAGLGLASIPLIVGPRPRRDSDGLANRDGRRALALIRGRGPVALGLCLVVLTIVLGRGVAWDRLFVPSGAEDPRMTVLPVLITMIVRYMPLGTGMGSFERLFRVHEPDTLLSGTYMNHAHNDWLEVLLTGGAPAALLLLVAGAAFVIQASRAWRSPAATDPRLRLVRLGLVIVALEGIASISDYPLRTPAHAMVLAVAALWAGRALANGRPLRSTSREHHVSA